MRPEEFIVSLFDEPYLNLRMVEPDHQAWHLTISDSQLTTHHILPLDAGVEAVEEAMIEHTCKKVLSARGN